jgi:hypothetical protein
MPSRREPWPDLVEKALFEKDPNLRPQRVKEAEAAILDRLLQIEEERQMLLEASEKLDALR